MKDDLLMRKKPLIQFSHQINHYEKYGMLADKTFLFMVAIKPQTCLHCID